MLKKVRCFLIEEKGDAELVTVALIAGVFVLIGIAAFTVLRPYILRSFEAIGENLESEVTG